MRIFCQEIFIKDSFWKQHKLRKCAEILHLYENPDHAHFTQLNGKCDIRKQRPGRFREDVKNCQWGIFNEKIAARAEGR